MGMRCFIAIDLDDSLKNEIDNATIGLRTGDWDVKWVPAENLHLTLKFLGETPEDSIYGLKEKLSMITAHNDPLEVHLHGIGIFPDKKRPRVVWIDLIDSEGLKTLQEKVEESALSLGFIGELRSFSPHLTIGRIRSSKGKEQLLRTIDTLKDKDFGNISVNKISLMKSELKPAGAQYTTLAEFYLKRRSNDQ